MLYDEYLNVGLYLWVSTEDQSRFGHSLGEQDDRLKDCSSHYSPSKEELKLLIDLVLKKILKDIKVKTNINDILNIKIKTKYKNICR